MRRRGPSALAGGRGTARAGGALLACALLCAVETALGEPAALYRHSGVPAPTAQDFAKVPAEWYTDSLQRRLPCNAFYTQGGQFEACLRIYVATKPPLDPARREQFGERYDPAKYYACRLERPPNQSGCEHLVLRRRESPEVWPYHLGQPAPIRWPEAPKVSVYREGMSALEYWRALCKAEAGEFIARTVPNVTAIYQVRPRLKESEYAYRDRYVMEDPYGYIESESGTLDGIPWFVTGPGWRSRKSSGSYAVFETPILEDDIHPTRHQYFPASLFVPPPPGRPFQQFSGYDKTTRHTMRMDYIAQPSSRYGWTWRGIRRPKDREVGVAGGELAVVDLRTGDILGLRRGFALGSIEAGKPVNWFHGNVCPEYHLMPGIGQLRQRSKDADFSLWFINKVLIPVGTYRD